MTAAWCHTPFWTVGARSDLPADRDTRAAAHMYTKCSAQGKPRFQMPPHSVTPARPRAPLRSKPPRWATQMLHQKAGKPHPDAFNGGRTKRNKTNQSMAGRPGGSRLHCPGRTPRSRFPLSLPAVPQPAPAGPPRPAADTFHHCQAAPPLPAPPAPSATGRGQPGAARPSGPRPPLHPRVYRIPFRTLRANFSPLFLLKISKTFPLIPKPSTCVVTL